MMSSGFVLTTFQLCFPLHLQLFFREVLNFLEGRIREHNDLVFPMCLAAETYRNLLAMVVMGIEGACARCLSLPKASNLETLVIAWLNVFCRKTTECCSAGGSSEPDPLFRGQGASGPQLPVGGAQRCDQYSVSWTSFVQHH